MDSKISVLKIGDKKHHFTEANLPALIHYKCKEWWSHYSMTLIANLALQWSKVLILTWYSAAKEEFCQEAKILIKQIAVVNTLTEVKKNSNKQVIIIHDDDEKLCLEAIKTLNDIDERIIFIKNIDIFHTPLIDECLKHNKLVLSGDLDLCPIKEKLLKRKFASVILFSQPKIMLPYAFVRTEPYVGYIRSKNVKWYVKSES